MLFKDPTQQLFDPSNGRNNSHQLRDWPLMKGACDQQHDVVNHVSVPGDKKREVGQRQRKWFYSRTPDCR